MDSSNHDINNKEKNLDNPPQSKDITPTRKDSLNMNDNENHKILNKEDHINESTNLNLDSKTPTGNQKSNTDFYHDKDITEDSIIYFTNKLQTSNKNYKFILYISVPIYIIDIFVYFKGDKNIHTYYNIITILAIFISSLHQAFSFRHDFKNISKELYSYTKKVLYLFIFIYLAFLFNMLYILFYEMRDIITTKYVYLDKTNDNIIIMTYIFSNIGISSIHLKRFREVKKSIKDLSSAKGEVYEGGNAGDVEIINNVINDI